MPTANVLSAKVFFANVLLANMLTVNVLYDNHFIEHVANRATVSAAGCSAGRSMGRTTSCAARAGYG